MFENVSYVDILFQTDGADQERGYKLRFYITVKDSKGKLITSTTKTTLYFSPLILKMK